MKLLCNTSLSWPRYQKHTYNYHRNSLHNQPFILNHVYFHDKPKLNTLCQKMQRTVSENFSPPSMFCACASKFVCRSTKRSLWLDMTMPESLRPYFMLARLHLPKTGIWLLAWPSYWSIALATSPGKVPDMKLMVLLGCISLLSATSARTINDLHDIEFDKQVERSKKRPLASGELTPLQGWCFWGLQLLLLTPFVLQLNKLSWGFVAAQQILVFVYPLMKRVTHLPQAFLGITVNLAVLVGWTAVKGNVDNANVFLPIYISGVFWTLIYDTIYAHQDKKDDVKAGVKSTAVLFGDSSTYWNLGFGAVCTGSLLLGGYNAHLGWPFYLFMIAATSQLLWQNLTVDLSDPSDCAKKFHSNTWFGALVFIGIVLGQLLY